MKTVPRLLLLIILAMFMLLEEAMVQEQYLIMLP